MGLEKILVRNQSEFAMAFTSRSQDVAEVEKELFPCILLFDGDTFIDYVSFEEFTDQEFSGTIRRVIDWWEEFTERNMPNSEYQVLLKARSELARQLEWLGRYVAELKKVKGTAQVMYQHQRDNVKVLKISSGETAGTATSMANVEVLPLKEKFLEAEKNYGDAFALWESCKQTLNAMAGICNKLGEEQKRINYQN